MFDYKPNNSRLYHWPGMQVQSLKLCTKNLMHHAGNVQLSWTHITTSPPSSPSLSSPQFSKYLCKALYKPPPRQIEISLKQLASHFRAATQPFSNLPCFWATAVLFWTRRRGLKESNRKSWETPLPCSDILNMQEKYSYLEIWFNWERKWIRAHQLKDSIFSIRKIEHLWLPSIFFLPQGS